MAGEKWTEEEDQLLRDNYQLLKSELLELFSHRSPASVNIRASKLGLKKYHNEYCQSKCSVLLEEDVNAYYWIGFILADGHISNNNRLIIHLANLDITHLYKFGDFISCSNIKHLKQEKCGISVQDKVNLRLVKEKFGIKNDKTYYPPDLGWIIDDKLFLALLIGYIDGDGCIRYQSNRKDTCISFHVHSSWLPFLNYIKVTLARIYGFNSGIPILGKDGYARYTISHFSLVKKLKKFVIEQNLSVLDRKWDKVDLQYKTKTEICQEKREIIYPLYHAGLSIREIEETTNIKNVRHFLYRNGYIKNEN